MTRICVNYSTVYNDTLVAKGLIETGWFLVNQTCRIFLLRKYIIIINLFYRLSDLQEMLHRQSDISVENQILISWENKLIRELLNSRDTLNKFPDTSLDQPALLWTRVEGLRNRKPDPMIIREFLIKLIWGGGGGIYSYTEENK